MNIYEVPEGRNYWVVRADGGRYFDHFVDHSVIALAHLDILELPDSEGKVFAPGLVELSSKLSKKHKSDGVKLGTTTSHVHQIKAFINGVKIGDWVMAIGKDLVRFGRVVSKARLSRGPLDVAYGQNKERVVSMSHNLRRRVVWGPSIKRDALPFGLLSSMRAYQAIFNINQHWEAVYHTLYPVFSKKDELFFSIKINSRQRINNYHVACLFNYLNEIEVISKYATDNITPGQFEDFFKDHALNYGVSTTTKAAFNSPGEIWAAIEAGLKKRPVITVLLGGYILLFGNTQLGFDGLIDVETRRQMWQLVLSRYEENHIKEVTRELQLAQPRMDTAVLESDSADEQE